MAAGAVDTEGVTGLRMKADEVEGTVGRKLMLWKLSATAVGTGASSAIGSDKEAGVMLLRNSSSLVLGPGARAKTLRVSAMA